MNPEHKSELPTVIDQTLEMVDSILRVAAFPAVMVGAVTGNQSLETLGFGAALYVITASVVRKSIIRD